MTLLDRFKRYMRVLVGDDRPMTAADMALPGPQSVWRAVERPVMRGFTLIGAFVLGFLSWAVLAPLDGGAVASGVISHNGSNQTVQHLEGGIIGKLQVRDGDIVKAGQPLLVLESVQQRAAYDLLLQEQRSQLAVRARLEAEKRGAEVLEFPAEIAGATDQQTQEIMADQRHVFATRTQIHLTQQRVLSQRVAELGEQIGGYQAQVDSAARQMALIADELVGKKLLFEKGLLPKPELRRLERAQAEIQGRRGEYSAAIASARQQIGEAELQLLALNAKRSDEIAAQLNETRVKLAEAQQKLHASKDVLTRTVIRAPVAGKVHHLRFKTEGGVVRGGEPILEVVPSHDSLLVEARIAPNDIDIVHAGLPAFVHLTAYSSRGTPKVAGKVQSISADRLLDETTRQSYYLARVVVAKEAIRELGSKVELLPGMPADVMIVTERRTLMEYLLQPLTDAWRRSFREA
jgi:HlyD family secretion protein